MIRYVSTSSEIDPNTHSNSLVKVREITSSNSELQGKLEALGQELSVLQEAKNKQAEAEATGEPAKHREELKAALTRIRRLEVRHTCLCHFDFPLLVCSCSGVSLSPTSFPIKWQRMLQPCLVTLPRHWRRRRTHSRLWLLRYFLI